MIDFMLDRSELLKDSQISSCVELLREKGAAQVYVFGSHARGTDGTDSDFDFGVCGLPPRNFFSAWYELELLSKKNVDLADFDEHPEFLRHLQSYNGAVLVAG